MTSPTSKRSPHGYLKHAPALILALAVASPSAAGDNWTLRVDASLTSVGGHDPYVLNVTGSSSIDELQQDLETQSDIGRHLGLGYDGSGRWSYAADFFFFTGAQELTVPRQGADAVGAATGYAISEREYLSLTPNSLLYFEQLGDTDMNAWTFDLCARRVIAAGDRTTLRLLLGLRNADFDNDNHFAAGIVDIEGSRIDASSNYGRMIGPLAGLVWDYGQGRSRLRFAVNASVVSGDAELSATLSDFLGPFTDGSENIVASRSFQRQENVTIPIVDARVEWRHNRGGRWTWVAGGHFAQWGDLSVPPGVQPDGTLDTLYQKSISFTSVLIGAEIGL